MDCILGFKQEQQEQPPKTTPTTTSSIMPSSSTRRHRRHRRRIKQLCLHPNRIQATSVYRHRQTSWNGQNNRLGSNNNNNLNGFWDGIDDYITTTDSKTTKNLSTRCPTSTAAARSFSSLSQRRIKQLSSGTAKTDPAHMADEEYEQRVIRQTEEHPFDEISIVVGEIAGNSSSSDEEDEDDKLKAVEDRIPKKKFVNFVHRMFQKMVKVGN